MKFKLLFLTLALQIPLISMQPDSAPASSSSVSSSSPAQPPIRPFRWFEFFNPLAAPFPLNATSNPPCDDTQESDPWGSLPLVPEARDAIKVSEKAVKEMGNVSKSIDKFTDDVTEKGLKINPETIEGLNKTGVYLMKTYLTAGVGGALAITGLVLLFKTLWYGTQDAAEKEDNRPLYKRLLTNRYLLSALLVGSGLGLILKSDRIVNAIS